jgi:hypothetical protein
MQLLYKGLLAVLESRVGSMVHFVKLLVPPLFHRGLGIMGGNTFMQLAFRPLQHRIESLVRYMVDIQEGIMTGGWWDSHQLRIDCKRLWVMYNSPHNCLETVDIMELGVLYRVITRQIVILPGQRSILLWLPNVLRSNIPLRW